MNFLTTLLEQYQLMESLASVIKSNPHIPEQTIRDYHSNALPDNNKNDRLLSHVLKLHKAGAITLETAHQFKPHLTALAATNQLHQLKNLNTLDDHINATKDILDKAVTKKERIDKDTPIIADTPNLLVTQHLTHESAIKGASLHPENPMYNKTNEKGKAQWCVSVGGSDGEEHYNEYTEYGRNPMYVIRNKKTKRSTAMVTNKDDIYNGSEIRDETDDLVSPYGLLKDNPGIEHVKPIMDHINRHMSEVHDVIKQVPFNANKQQLLAAINSNNDNYKGAATEHNLLPHINEISNNGKMYMVHKDIQLPSEHIFKLIKEHSGEENINQRKIIAHYKYLEPHHIDTLITDTSPGVREVMARRDDLKPHHIDALVKSKDPKVRAIIAHRDDLEPHHIDALIKDDSLEVRANLTQCKNLKPHHIDALVDDKDDEVLNKIAYAKKLKPEHIDQLFHKGSWLVDQALIKRSDLKPHHIERYITKGTPDERRALSHRKDLDTHYIDTLIKDTSPGVREAIAQRKKLESHHKDILVNDTHIDVLSNMAKRKDLEPHHIDALVKSKDPKVRAIIAKRKDLKSY